MKIAMIGLGRMGAGITRRLLRGGHEVVVWDRAQEAIDALAKDGATAATLDRRHEGQARYARGVLGDAPGRPAHRPDGQDTGRHRRKGRHHHRRRQHLLQGRHRARQGPGDAWHRLCRCRHVWRGMGAGARLLHDDRRREAGGRPSRPDLRPRWHPGSARSRARRIAWHRRAKMRVPRRAISTPARPARAISSRWCTTASNMA